MRAAAIIALARAAAAPGAVRADWSCRVAEWCPTGEACRPAGPGAAVSIWLAPEGWVIVEPDVPATPLRALTAADAPWFLAVSAEGEETAMAVSVAPDGALDWAIIDTYGDPRRTAVVRGSCAKE